MRARIAIVCALALVMLLPATTLGASARTYHGVFTSGVISGCPTGVPDPATMDIPMPAWGNWNVVIVGDRAEVHATVFADMGSGPIHVDSFGGVKDGSFVVMPPASGETFHVRIPSDAVYGNRIDFILRGTTLEFGITPYFDCASGTTWGALR
ncbi:MAG TPA: hypothetical protein VFP22_03895 [Candidatus Limnocylindrales bacterium]|nr:hypothetical protein [Candidatus Limnocylindrales bacterium]